MLIDGFASKAPIGNDPPHYRSDGFASKAPIGNDPPHYRSSSQKLTQITKQRESEKKISRSRPTASAIFGQNPSNRDSDETGNDPPHYRSGGILGQNKTRAEQSVMTPPITDRAFWTGNGTPHYRSTACTTQEKDPCKSEKLSNWPFFDR